MKIPQDYSLGLQRGRGFALMLGALALLTPLLALAQSSATGVIAGRVLNPATGEYIRNAEVRIEGTAQSAVTEGGGYYQLPNAPVGTVTVIATYTGHETATATVNVVAGQTATHDFELAPTFSRKDSDDVVKLGAFVVETEREGQAKAVSEQKTALNMKTVVASDNFGDIAEGNVGEFLKFMPGITLDYVETDTRAARMGGMEARYGYVTLDGGTIANTSTGSFGGDTRQFEFEAVSINNVESIEVNKTLTADMPADAPAGTVNLRTRSALDRKRPSFNYSVGFIGNQYEHSFSSTPRQDDAKHPKTRPMGGFDYSSGPLFNGHLGISLNSQFTNVYKEQFRHSLTYDYTSTQAQAAGHPLITAINYKDGPKITEKSSGGMKIDFQPWDKTLRMYLTSSYTYFSDEIANRNLNFRVSSANIDPSSTLTKIIALPSGNNANTRIEQTGSTGDKKTDTTNAAAGFIYRTSRVTADGQFSYSRARQQNGAYHMGAVDTANVQLTRIGWTAERSSVDSPSWYFTQTSGPSWYDLQNYGASDTQSNNVTETRARAKTEQYVGQLNFKYIPSWRLPSFIKAGLYDQVTTRHRDQNVAYTATYIGPNGNQLQAPMPASIASFWIAKPWGSNILPLPVPDKSALYVMVRDHPEYFSNTTANQVANLDSILGSVQNNQEQIGAGYVMASVKLSPRVTLLAGLRGENTRTITEVPLVVPVSKNPYAIKNANGTYTAPTTSFDYTRYKYSQGLDRGYGRYTDYMPSASARFDVTRNFDIKLGYNKAIKRPPLSDIAGAWSINSADTIITIPNPNLTPARANKFSALFEYYFEPAGTVSLHVFETQINNDDDQTSPLPSSAVGLQDDPVYGAYEFITYYNIPGTRKIKGIELNYAQQLVFLPGVLRGTSVFATFSQYNSNPRPGGFVPRNASGGINWRYWKVNFKIAGTWTDRIYTGSNTVTSSSKYFPGDTEILQARKIFDVGLGFSITRDSEIRIDGRNAFNSGKTWAYANSDGRIRQMERYGGQWTISYRGHY